MKKLISIMLCLCLLFSLAACGNESANSTPEAEPTVEPTPEPSPEPTPEPLIDEAALALDLSDAQWEKSADGSYYQLMDVNFCTNVVVDKYQTMNIYVPAEYLEGGSVCGYTADTAPIVLQNNCSGWRSGSAGNVDKTMLEMMNATAIMLKMASGEQAGDPADHWRTRNGTADEHTSFTVAYDLAMSALMAGAESVDYSLVWAMNHGDAEGTSTGTFIDWVHSICGD